MGITRRWKVFRSPSSDNRWWFGFGKSQWGPYQSVAAREIYALHLGRYYLTFERVVSYSAPHRTHTTIGGTAGSSAGDTPPGAA